MATGGEGGGSKDHGLNLQDGDLVLRDHGNVVGVHSTRKRARVVPEPVQTPEPHRHSRHEAATKIARAVVESTVKETEEQALAHAQELISDAAERLAKNSKITRKPASRGGWLSFLKKL